MACWRFSLRKRSAISRGPSMEWMSMSLQSDGSNGRAKFENWSAWYSWRKFATFLERWRSTGWGPNRHGSALLVSVQWSAPQPSLSAPPPLRVWMMSRLRLARTHMLHLIPKHLPESSSWSKTPGVDHHLSALKGYVTPPDSTCQYRCVDTWKKCSHRPHNQNPYHRSELPIQKRTIVIKQFARYVWDCEYDLIRLNTA